MNNPKIFMVRDETTGTLSPGGYDMYDTWKADLRPKGRGRAYNQIGAVKRTIRGMLRTTGRKRIPDSWEIVEVKRISVRSNGLKAKHLVYTDPLVQALDIRFNAPRKRRRVRSR